MGDKQRDQPNVLDFEAIVEKYTNYVYNVAYRMMGNPEDAEDVTQEALFSAYKALDRFRGDAQITTWLYRITINACLMRLRREKKRRLLTQTGYDERELVNWTESPERTALNAELLQKLEEAISRLPSELRAAVILRDVQGLPNNQAAEVLGVTTSSLKARLHRGRVILRKFLSDYLKTSR